MGMGGTWECLTEKLTDAGPSALFGFEVDTGVMVGIEPKWPSYEAILLRLRVEMLVVTYLKNAVPPDLNDLTPPPPNQNINPNLLAKSVIPLWPLGKGHPLATVSAWFQIPPFQAPNLYGNLLEPYLHQAEARRTLVGTSLLLPRYNGDQIGMLDESETILSGDDAFYADVLASTENPLGQRRILDPNFNPPQSLVIGQPPIGTLHFSISCTQDAPPGKQVFPFQAKCIHQVWAWKK